MWRRAEKNGARRRAEKNGKEVEKGEEGQVGKGYRTEEEKGEEERDEKGGEQGWRRRVEKNGGWRRGSGGKNGGRRRRRCVMRDYAIMMEVEKNECCESSQAVPARPCG